MSDTVEYLKTFARFPFSLRRFLRHPLTPDEAKRIARERLAQREENFLRIVKRSIYGYSRSPYLALLKHAGCEFGDVQAAVKDKGVEGALCQLREAGVYVTYEEFKGRKPVVRGGLNLPVRPRDFDNPYAGADMSATTGGSTGLGTHIAHNLDHMAAASHHQCLMLDAYNMTGAPGVVWLPIMPGTGLSFIMRRVHLREPVRHWYSYIGWRDSKYWLKYDVALLYMLFWLRVFEAGVPMPEIVRPDEALIVARSIRERLDEQGRCMFYTSVSYAVRVCLAAEQAGFDLKGSAVRLSGEPATPAKVRVIERAGMRPVPNYGSVETGPMSVACLNPVGADDTHLWSDAFALITHPFPVQDTDLIVPAFNLTTLLEQSPKMMLNYQTDDYGILEERACGCDFEAYGYTTHLREIRSYSKLVGEGVTLIGNEMLRLIEEVLPARFGGTPLDYQWMEAEDERGFTRLYLVISPRVRIADEGEVIAAVHAALGDSSPMADAARTILQQTQTIQIKRAEPVVTARGKLLPLHLHRSK